MEFPLSFFAFPLNLILLILWVCLVVHWRKKVKLSSWVTLSAIIIFLVIALVVGFTGNRDILKSWPVVLFLLYFQTVLLLVVRNGQNVRLASTLVSRSLDVFGEKEWSEKSEEEKERVLTPKQREIIREVVERRPLEDMLEESSEISEEVEVSKEEGSVEE